MRGVPSLQLLPLWELQRAGLTPAAWTGAQVAGDCFWRVEGADPRQPPASLEADLSPPPCWLLFLPFWGLSCQVWRGKRVCCLVMGGGGRRVNRARSKVEGQGPSEPAHSWADTVGRTSLRVAWKRVKFGPSLGRVLLGRPGDSCGCPRRVLCSEHSFSSGAEGSTPTVARGWGSRRHCRVRETFGDSRRTLHPSGGGVPSGGRWWPSATCLGGHPDPQSPPWGPARARRWPGVVSFLVPCGAVCAGPRRVLLPRLSPGIRLCVLAERGSSVPYATGSPRAGRPVFPSGVKTLLGSHLVCSV